jgi:uncharacterized protein YbjT (DUF2867 family)
VTTLVTGATGRLGRPTVARLVEAGHEVRSLSRRTGPGLATGDLATGAGLAEAVAGVDVVVHLATGSRGDDVATANLVRAAAAAGVRHLVHMSIVGIDDIPLGHYRTKLAAERAVTSSGLPHTVLRATQFHDLVVSLFAVQRLTPVVVAPRFAVQPIAVTDVADRLVELAGGPPGGRVADIGGPEVRPLPDLAQVWRRAAGVRRPVVPVVLPGRTFAGYAAGANLVPGPPYGRRTFEEHVAASVTSGGRGPSRSRRRAG